MYTITPSLPAQTFEEISSLAKKLDGIAPMLQVDIVDGVFVPLRSWPFTNHAYDVHEELAKLSSLPQTLPLEIDCMVMHPEQYLDTLCALSAKSVIIHMRSTTAYHHIIMHARLHGYKIGFAITNDDDVRLLAPYICEIDFVQVMGIAHVGTQGQPFDRRTLTTLTQLRLAYPKLTLVVDGAVNADTILTLRDAGATRFAPGSYIAKATDPVIAYKHLCVLLNI